MDLWLDYNCRELTHTAPRIQKQVYSIELHIGPETQSEPEEEKGSSYNMEIGL